MRWLPLLLACLPFCVVALPRLDLGVGAIEHPLLQARSLKASLDGDVLIIEAAQARLAGRRLEALRLRCNDWRMGRGIACRRGRIELGIPGYGRLVGGAHFEYLHPQRWRIELVSGELGGFELSAWRGGEATHLELDAPRLPAAEVLKLAAALGFDTPYAPSARLGLKLSVRLDGGDWQAGFEGAVVALDVSADSGRYASEGLGLRFGGHATPRRLTLDLATDGGQVYVDPIFLDLVVTPLTAVLTAERADGGWRIDGRLEQAAAWVARLATSLDDHGQPGSTQIEVDAAALGPAFASLVQPFLIGTPVEDLQLSGAAQIRLALARWQPQRLSASLQVVSVAGERLGLALERLSGELHWREDSEAAPSQLRWDGGSLQKVDFGASTLSFAATPRGLRLLQPWRQPLLGGALSVQRLSLRRLNTDQAQAELDAELEPIDLGELCRALGWPEFGGQLGGRLPGLSIDDEVWTVDGRLEAEVFGGRVGIDGLRAVDPFGVVPSVEATLRLRDIDLARLTSAFSFGRIEGRLDGDVDNLRLLDWLPVAMDAHLYSSPGGGYPRRISQRAIDHISAIGGGPTGLLSRGVLQFFDDFAYDEIGWRCRLDNGVCNMGGLAPADGGYVIVKGRLLPRIDIIGHNRRVDWDRLLRQVRAAIAGQAGPGG